MVGDRRRGKGGAQETAAPQPEAKKETPARPAKTDAPQSAEGKGGEAPRREGEGQRRRRSRGGRGRGGDKPVGQNTPNTDPNTNTAAPKPEASPRPEGAGEGQRRRRSRGGRRRSGGSKTGGTSNSEA